MINLQRILLAEDDPRDEELTLKALSEHNIADDIFVCSDGAQTLDYLYRRGEFAQRIAGNPVVVLLDLKMPKVDGIQVLKVIKNDPKLKRIPVVVLTSSSETNDLNICYELGVNAYVVKPVRFEEFMHAIKQLGIFWALINKAPIS